MTCRQSGQALTISWVPPRSALMEKIDENMDGKISAAEFMTWVRERHVQEYRDTAISQVQTAAPRGKAGFLVLKQRLSPLWFSPAQPRRSGTYRSNRPCS